MKCYQEFIIKSKTKTAYNSIYYKRKTNECFDNILLWIIVIITTFDNHAFDEDNIDIGKEIQCKVVVNHHIELTEEEKAEARIQKMKNRKKAKPAQTQTIVAPTLFDF